MPPARPFWAGLDPDKPEPLDKVLAALHCHQVSPPSAADAFYFEFTVNREDHHRIDNGFPELQELSGAIRGSRDVLKPSIPFVSNSPTPLPTLTLSDKTPLRRSLTHRLENLRLWPLLCM